MDRVQIIKEVEMVFLGFIVEENKEEEEEGEEDSNLIVFNVWNEAEDCVYIKFAVMMIDSNLITIDNIDNCGDIGIGNAMLSLIDTLARIIGSRAIELIDHSKIQMGKSSVSLAILNTLKSGQTWYSSRGYSCNGLTPVQHAARVNKNTEFIQSSHMNEIGIETDMLDKIYRKNPALVPTLNVQTYFVIVTEIFKEWKNCKYIKSLTKLIEKIDKLKVLEVECQNDMMIKQITDASGIYTKKRRKKRKRHNTFRHNTFRKKIAK